MGSLKRSALIHENVPNLDVLRDGNEGCVVLPWTQPCGNFFFAGKRCIFKIGLMENVALLYQLTLTSRLVTITRKVTQSK